MSEFVEKYRKQFPAWESAAVHLALDGQIVPWPLVPVTVTSPDGQHTAVFQAASDYLALGPDPLRIPLTPLRAQEIANGFDMMLPTPKMVDAIWQAAPVKLTPHPMPPNKGADLDQYLEHEKAIDSDDPSYGLAPLKAGHKKDIVISKLMAPGKVVIYGWHRPDGSHIQPHSNVHGDFYVDYSHGVRLIGATALVDGEERRVDEILKDPVLAWTLSDSGPLKTIRYPTTLNESAKMSYGVLGLAILMAQIMSSSPIGV